MMDESIWKFAQIVMWFVGVQTGLLGGIFVFLWSNLSKKIDKQGADLQAKIDKQGIILNDLDKRLSELDKRLYGIETVLHMKDCCVLKQDQNLKKAE